MRGRSYVSGGRWPPWRSSAEGSGRRPGLPTESDTDDRARHRRHPSRGESMAGRPAPACRDDRCACRGNPGTARHRNALRAARRRERGPCAPQPVLFDQPPGLLGGLSVSPKGLLRGAHGVPAEAPARHRAGAHPRLPGHRGTADSGPPAPRVWADANAAYAHAPMPTAGRSGSWWMSGNDS